MRSGRVPSELSQRAALATAVFAAYVATAAFAQQFAVTPGDALSVWYPPPGILLVVLHRVGLWVWPVAIVAEAVVGLWVYDVGDEFGAARLALNSVLVTGAYVLGSVALSRGRFDPRLGRRRDLVVFVLAAFLVSAPLAGLAGVGIQRWAGIDAPGFGQAWAAWWVGDAIGMLVIAPLLLLPMPGWRRWAGWVKEHVDLLAVGQAIAVVGMPVAVFAVADDPYRVLYAPLLPVILVAGLRGTGPAAFAVLATVMSMTVAARLDDGGTVERYDLQLVLLVIAAVGHALGLAEQLRSRAQGRYDELVALIDTTSDLVAVLDAKGNMEWANPAAERVLGLELRLPVALDEGAVRVARERGMWRGSATVAGPAGDALRLSQVLVALPALAGEEPKVGLVARDVTDLHRVADQLTRLTFVDQLTGLANRARLAERLAYALGDGSEPHHDHGVAIIDIDRFATLNDRLGRDGGDAVLRVVADRLQEDVRGGELLVRLADDRFAVLLEDIPDTFTAVTVAERLRAAACGPLGPELGGTVVTASAGVVVAETGEDPDVVLRRADLALQRAKQAGGAATAPYDPALSERLQRRIDVEGRLRVALAGDGWPLRYQPMVDLRTGELVACEALLEPIDPPLEVVDVAEELGLIGDLGHQVLVAALRQAVRWRERVPDLRMSVNVSAQQLLEAGFPHQVDQAVRAAGIPASALVLEITETVFADDRIEAAIAATLLQGMGVRISVDDFGTGFSSLGRLRALPVDELKIDRAFVADLGRLDGADAIVAAVVALGAARRLDVVAEGIEEPEQHAILREVGCGFGQGWLFAKPMAPEAFDGWLDQHLAAGTHDHK